MSTPADSTNPVTTQVLRCMNPITTLTLSGAPTSREARPGLVRPIMARLGVPLCLAAIASLTGCANFAGVGGASSFHCQAPEGVPCQSVSGVDANERAGNLPGQRRRVGPGLPGDEVATLARPTASSSTARGVPAAEAASFSALRSAPTYLRIWVAPWEDADGDLNDQSFIYLQLDTGRWLVDRARERAHRPYAPQLAPQPAAQQAFEPVLPASGARR